MTARPQVFFRTIAHIRARDLNAYQHERTPADGPLVARIDGRWREVFEVWQDGDDPATTFGPDSPYTRIINDYLGRVVAGYVVLRYLVEEDTTDVEMSDALHAVRTCDLLEVQVPAEATPDQLSDRPR